MAQAADKSQNALFIYTKDDSGKFWVFDGSQYHHFFVEEAKFWYIRSQDYLPAFTSGRGYMMRTAERLSLQREASKQKIKLPFFQTIKECEDNMLVTQHAQHIFDCTFPGGFFYQNNDMPQKNEDEQGE